MDWSLKEVVFLQAPNGTRKSSKNGDSHATNLQLNKVMEDERQERESIVLWKKPFTTLHYFLVELCLTIQEYTLKYVLFKKKN